MLYWKSGGDSDKLGLGLSKLQDKFYYILPGILRNVPHTNQADKILFSKQGKKSYKQEMKLFLLASDQKLLFQNVLIL